MKICTKCKLPKDEGEFPKRAASRDGLTYWCKSCFATYHQKNKVKTAAQTKTYYKVNKAEIAAQQAAYRQANKAEILAKKAVYYQKNKVEAATYERERRLADPIFKLTGNLRTRLTKAIKGSCRSGSSVRDLGCTIPELKAHLESQFYSNPITGESMSWENYGPKGWHIDHKKPLSLLQKDPSNRALFLELNHYTNLQPLWAIHNLAKGDKLDWQRMAA